VRDSTTETHAATIDFDQTNGDIHATGTVRSTTYSTKGATPQLAAVPASIASEKMDANSKTGRALYSGHARLWQGDSVMESDAIELFQKTRQLHANGNVRAVFPEQPTQQQKTVSVAPAKGPAARKPNLWHVASRTLSYEDLEDRAHLEGNVIVQSESQRMRSDVLDLYFTHAAMPATASAGTPQTAADGASRNPAGAQQISRAVGTGGVIVIEEARKATAERAEYTAADGKFVMSGGNPTLYDGTEGTTKGRQLTFFLADDTIIVDSENGSRTLTKHRVEK
jgi:lipopolysaccharide export system protein LptA